VLGDHTNGAVYKSERVVGVKHNPTRCQWNLGSRGHPGTPPPFHLRSRIRPRVTGCAHPAHSPKREIVDDGSPSSDGVNDCRLGSPLSAAIMISIRTDDSPSHGLPGWGASGPWMQAVKRDVGEAVMRLFAAQRAGHSQTCHDRLAADWQQTKLKTGGQFLF
jgi:hypothetical protein